MADFEHNAVTAIRLPGNGNMHAPLTDSFPDRALPPRLKAARESCVGLGHAGRLHRWLAPTVIAAVVAAGAAESGSALGDTGRNGLAVSLVVPPVAVLQVQHQVPELRVTEADVARGYVDVPEGSHLAIRTTSREGYLLEFQPRLPLFTSVLVTSPAGRSEIGRDGGTLVARGPTGRPMATRLSYRFHLDANARPGAYPWPLALSVRPL